MFSKEKAINMLRLQIPFYFLQCKIHICRCTHWSSTWKDNKSPSLFPNWTINILLRQMSKNSLHRSTMLRIWQRKFIWIICKS